MTICDVVTVDIAPGARSADIPPPPKMPLKDLSSLEGYRTTSF